MALNIIATIFVAIIFALLFVEVRINLSKKKKKFTFGNAQYIGQMEYQNDYFSINEIEEKECLLIVTDGASTNRNIKNGSILANDIIKNLYLKNRTFQSFKKILEFALLDVEEKNKMYAFENRIGVSILAVKVNEYVLEYANVGSCVLLVFRDDNILQVVESDRIYEKIDSFKLKAKDKVILLSKGAFVSIDELELIAILNTKQETNDKAISIINIIRNKRYKHQENATVVLLEIN